MSYRCTQLANVPTRQGLRYYVYVLEDPDTETHSLSPDEFDHLGALLDSQALAVAGSSRTFSTEVIHTYVSDLRARQRIEERYRDFPMLLVTDLPPSALHHVTDSATPQHPYALVPLGPLEQRERQEAIHFLAKALTDDGISISELQRHIETHTRGSAPARFLRKIHATFQIGFFQLHTPSLDEVIRP